MFKKETKETRKEIIQELLSNDPRSKSFIDWLQTAKQEQQELKIKSVNFSKAHRRAYIVLNLRKNYNHKVEIG